MVRCGRPYNWSRRSEEWTIGGAWEHCISRVGKCSAWARRRALKKGVLWKSVVIFVLVLFFTVSSGSAATQKTHRRPPTKHSASAAKASADKAAADNARDARLRVASQIKVLTHFVYLFAGIQKGMELGDTAGPEHDTAGTGHEASTAALELNNKNKAKLRASIASIQQALEKLETDFRFTTAFKNYSPYLTGVANIGQQAQNQAAANRFDDAGKSLLKALDQLTDALAAIH